jgi:uncharacterized protein (TIGR00251 family)
VNLPPFVSLKEAEVWLAVKVQPRAAKNEIVEVTGNELKIKVAAPPVDSAANEALVKFLAETLDCAKGNVRLVRGATSRHKIIAIRSNSANLSVTSILSSLSQALANK